MIVGEQFTDTITATDEDTNDTVTVSVNGLPDGATFDSETGVFVWTPQDTSEVDSLRYNHTLIERTVCRPNLQTQDIPPTDLPSV